MIGLSYALDKSRKMGIGKFQLSKISTHQEDADLLSQNRGINSVFFNLSGPEHNG